MLGQGSLEAIGNATIRYSLASSYWLSIISKYGCSIVSEIFNVEFWLVVIQDH